MVALEQAAVDALEHLRTSHERGRLQARDEALRAINDWAITRQRRGQPLSEDALDLLAGEINAVCGADPRGGSAILRIGHRLHTSTRVRFH